MERDPPPQTLVCVFAKPPVAGQVKQRLAATVGHAAAASLARAFLLDTWEPLQGLSWVQPVLSSTAYPSPELLAALGITAEDVWLQGDRDLGARVERTLRRALTHAPCAIAVGADSPGLPPEFLARAHHCLVAGAPSVLGPCDDGGFYLLGLRRRCPNALLARLPWSHATTYAATRARLIEEGLAPLCLPQWFDVDDLAQLRRLCNLARASRVHIPHTLRALRGLELGSLIGQSRVPA